jgi:hypothetical protein
VLPAGSVAVSVPIHNAQLAVLLRGAVFGYSARACKAGDSPEEVVEENCPCPGTLAYQTENGTSLAAACP